jgi:hypothetical protein
MNERIEAVLPPPHLIDDDQRDWPTDDPADRRKVVQEAAARRVVRQLKQDAEAFKRRLEDEKRAHEAEGELVLRINHAGYVRLVKAAFADMIESFIDEIRREISTDDMHPSVLEAVSAGDGMEAKTDARAVVMQEHTVGDAAGRGITSTLYESKWMRRPDNHFRFVVSRRLLARRGIHALSLPSELEPEFHADTLLQEALEKIALPELPPENEWDETIQRHAERQFRIRIANAVLQNKTSDTEQRTNRIRLPANERIAFVGKWLIDYRDRTDGDFPESVSGKTDFYQLAAEIVADEEGREEIYSTGAVRNWLRDVGCYVHGNQGQRKGYREMMIRCIEHAKIHPDLISEN